MKKLFALATIATTAMFLACGSDGDSSSDAKDNDNENAADSLDIGKAVTANFQCDYVNDATSKIALKAVGSTILSYDSVMITFTRGDSQDKIVLDSMTIDPEDSTYSKTLYDVSSVQLQYMIHRYCVDSTEVTDENASVFTNLGCTIGETTDKIYMTFSAPGAFSEQATFVKGRDAMISFLGYIEDPDYSVSDYCTSLKEKSSMYACDGDSNTVVSEIMLTNNSADSVWRVLNAHCDTVTNIINDYTGWLDGLISSSSEAKAESSSSKAKED